MVRQLEREVINKYSWLERANITSGYGINLLFDFADLDELCKDIEGELDSKALGAGFLSQGLRIDEFAEHRCSLLTYINDVLYDIDSYLEEPLYKGFNEAVDLMAAIDMTDGKTDNTLGVQKNVTVNGGGRGYGFEVELPELNLEDFIGSRYEETKGSSYERSNYNQKVDNFADLFAKDYEELVENGKIDSTEKSLQDYLNELILREFAHKKDAPFWKELLEQLSDLTIVIPIYEAATGKTLITVDYLTDTEGAFKLVSATVSLVTLGQGALVSKGGVAFAKLFAAEVVSEAAAGTTVIVCDRAGVPSAVTISLAMLLGTTAGMAANKALIPEDFSKWMTKEEAGRYNQYWSEVQGRQGLNDYNYYGTLGDSYYKNLTEGGYNKNLNYSAIEDMHQNMEDIFTSVNKNIYEIIETINKINYKNLNTTELNMLLVMASNISGLRYEDLVLLKSCIIKNAGFNHFDWKGIGEDIKGFVNLDINIVELDEPLILYRRGYPDEPGSQNGLGRWWGDKYRTIDEVRNELAVLEDWGNPLVGEYTIIVPKGEKVLTGLTAPQKALDEFGNIIESRGGGAVQYWLNDIPTEWLLN
ncbi:hypothetical protein R2R35_05020 [Anaerocolumna sp. AGMB13020]|uniref:hypothetical protein n=1 Tax=Anaerocolumna sp. AGMB13020 TaxID=3081750 RepID=UPI002952F7FB|nr:hypothetical protein [Anaerocolumna sp. AGMB13020]WOO37866.1 hypothetical protein R2R35_05020 [Anaerocolumna sp. AGMB13020]